MSEMTFAEAMGEARKFGQMMRALSRVVEIVDLAAKAESALAEMNARLDSARQEAERIVAAATAEGETVRAETAALRTELASKKDIIAAAKSEASDIVAAAKAEGARVKAEQEAHGASLVTAANERVTKIKAEEVAALNAAKVATDAKVMAEAALERVNASLAAVRQQAAKLAGV